MFQEDVPALQMNRECGFHREFYTASAGEPGRSTVTFDTQVVGATMESLKMKFPEPMAVIEQINGSTTQSWKRRATKAGSWRKGDKSAAHLAALAFSAQYSSIDSLRSFEVRPSSLCTKPTLETKGSMM